MKKQLMLIVSSLLLSVPLIADSVIDSRLAPYKRFLINGTYDGQDWLSFLILPKSRYDTYRKAFSLFKENQGKTVVELGTSRSFTHGGHIGCNMDNPEYWTPGMPQNWDWGGGFFTRIAAESLSHLNPEFHSVDSVVPHISRCKVITDDFSSIMSYYVSSYTDFLMTCDFPNGIDLLYLNTGEITPLEPSALMQLEEAKIIVERNLISPNGLILINDVRNQTPKKFGEPSDLGKAKYSLPYLLENGFEIVMDEYQVLLKRSK